MSLNVPYPPSSFSARKNGNQTGIASNTLTLITFDTELYDIGANYDTSASAWTPPAGKIYISARVECAGTWSLGTTSQISIYKGAGAIFTRTMKAPANSFQQELGVLTSANGTDAFTVYAMITTSSGTITALSDSTDAYGATNFMGHWVAP